MADPTPYIEANAILAAQENDTDEVERLVGLLTDTERMRPARACRALNHACNDSCIRSATL